MPVSRPVFFPQMNVRLQKFLADAGIASRRGGEQIILDGRVEVNGKVVTELGTKVDPNRDVIMVDGAQVRARKKLYIAVNKPRGYICTKVDPERRKCIGELLPKEWDNLNTVGRLDRESEGLIFMTNDGDFSLHLTHPRYGILKRYWAAVPGKLDPKLIEPFLKGVEHDGERLRATSVRILETSNRETTVELDLREGKNREVRRMFETINLEVLRLRRVQIGKIKLGDLPEGKWRTLTEPEIKSLLSTS
jgi:23S rRNA pseudouridine2605 synthase